MADTRFYAQSNKETWCTPLKALKPVWQFAERVGGIGLDPCGHPLSQVNARQAFTGPRWGGLDGLTRSWRGFGGLVFVNPPYGKKFMPLWARKISNEAADGTEMLVLIPSSSSVGWWETIEEHMTAMCLWRGRMKFTDRETGKKGGATFSSAFLYYGPRVPEFFTTFKEHGRIWLPADTVQF